MMLRLVCAFVARKQQSQVFSRRISYDIEAGCCFVVRKQQSQGFQCRGPYDVEAGLLLCCSQATKSGVFESHLI